MAKWSRYFVIFSILISLIAFTQTSAQQNCSTTFSNNKSYATCITLPVLNSFLHWNYHASNQTVDIAYRHTGVSPFNWVAWALNPTGSGMIGAQCLVAFRNSTGNIYAYTSPVANTNTRLAEGPLSFGVPRIESEFRNNNEMIIFASVQLPTGRTSFNQVWQVGQVSGDVPQMHSMASDNQRSSSNVDFVSGQVSGGGGIAGSRQRKRNVHGVLNVMSWGILMPLGAVIARYLKVFKSATPAWFYLHVACQTSAYIVGVAGWGTGLKLGSDSVGITQDTHRTIGITMFCLGTLQVFALLLRPKPDHKYRLYWNIYHYVIGYTVIILSIVNIFKGFDILKPEKKWKNAYIGVIIAIGAIAATLEAFTWFIVLKRKRAGSSTDKYPYNSNGVNGVNGYGARQQQAV
ncbi:hypothetical protein ACH5RR_037095 [Cinchona calisaya]|uniref:Cytochrome b561 and DOMON domain-containing protein n=1 Tax=Cinchona calisaya TaxID=153742 RepID=A0ABD2Y7F6_9GENT